MDRLCPGDTSFASSRRGHRSELLSLRNLRRTAWRGFVCSLIRPVSLTIQPRDETLQPPRERFARLRRQKRNERLRMTGRARAGMGEHQPPPLTEVEVNQVRAVLALGGLPWDELDDGVQQVRLKLLEEQADPARPPVRNPAAWLSVVASRVAVDWHRARRRDDRLRERLAARWLRRPPDHPEEHRVLALVVADGLDALPALQRQVLILRFYVDLPVRDIARLLDVPEGTVKSRLNGAVLALRTALCKMEVI